MQDNVQVKEWKEARSGARCPTNRFGQNQRSNCAHTLITPTHTHTHTHIRNRLGWSVR